MNFKERRSADKWRSCSAEMTAILVFCGCDSKGTWKLFSVGVMDMSADKQTLKLKGYRVLFKCHDTQMANLP